MSDENKATQQELMKKYLEEQKHKNSNGNKKFTREKDKSTKSTSKVKRSHNGGGFFDK